MVRSFPMSKPPRESLQISIPTRRDPLARGVLLALIGGAVYLALARPDVAPAQAQGSGPIIVVATPALPTPALALELAAPTPAPFFDAPTAAPDAQDMPAGLPISDEGGAPAETPPDAPAADNSQYLANVGEQAPHCIRSCDNGQPPPSQTGPILYPATDENAAYIISPAVEPTAAPAAPAIAVAVPPISEAQAAVLSQRDSNGCAPGQVFYPRTGCHTPGSGGPQPGAVGAP